METGEGLGLGLGLDLDLHLQQGLHAFLPSRSFQREWLWSVETKRRALSGSAAPTGGGESEQSVWVDRVLAPTTFLCEKGWCR